MGLNRFLYDFTHKEDGWSELATMVIAGAICGMFILLFLIPMFKTTVKNIQVTEAATNRNDKVIVTHTLGVYKEGESSGGDIIGVIRHFENDTEITVTVTNNGGTHTYIAETYDENVFSIGREDKYTLTTTENDHNIITNYNYTVN